MEREIKIEDKSGDKNYFTIVPNYILNHSTATAQALYLQLKRLAGDRGMAYSGRRYLMEKLRISKNTLRKEFEYLLEKGWIKYAGEKEVDTDGGKQKVKAYKIVDLWKINAEYYQKGGQNRTTLEQRGVKIDPQGGSTRGVKIDPKEDPCNNIHSSNKNIAAEAADSSKKKKKYDDPTPMNLQEFVDWYKKSPQRHIRIIADFADQKKAEFTTKGQWQAFADRNMRAARDLSPYTDEQIAKAVKAILKSDYIEKWGLETVAKYLIN